jgi:hypothetical protein
MARRPRSARAPVALRRWFRFAWLERLPHLDLPRFWQRLFRPRRLAPANDRYLRRCRVEVLEGREVANDLWAMVLTGVSAAGAVNLPSPARMLLRGWDFAADLDYFAARSVTAAAVHQEQDRSADTATNDAALSTRETFATAAMADSLAVLPEAA